MPAGFWIAVGIQALVFVLWPIGRNKITEDDYIPTIKTKTKKRRGIEK